jgi:hypothetical protein
MTKITAEWACSAVRCVAFLVLCTALGSSTASGQGSVRGTVQGPRGVDLSEGVVYACHVVQGRCDISSPQSKYVMIGGPGPIAPFDADRLGRGEYIIVAYVDRNRTGAPDIGDLMALHANADGTAALVRPPHSGLILRLFDLDASVIAILSGQAQPSGAGSQPPASASARTAAGAPATRPPAGRELDGIYTGVRLDAGVVNQYGQTLFDPTSRVYTFFPDGRVLRSAPHDGYNRAVDWGRACTAEADYLNPCGSYEIVGDEVQVRWAVGYRQVYRRNGDELVMLRHHWDDTSPRTRALELVHLKRTPTVEGLRLDGRYTSTVRPNVSITFAPDGRFVEQGLVEPLLSAGMPWDEYGRREALAQRMPSGAGTYSIGKYTLELRYDNGEVIRHLLYLPPEYGRVAQPGSVSIGNAPFVRAR